MEELIDELPNFDILSDSDLFLSYPIIKTYRELEFVSVNWFDAYRTEDPKTIGDNKQ